MKLVGLLTAFPFAALADPPSLNELEANCAGVAPGKPNRLCTKMKVQDQNAKAAECFHRDSSEAGFGACFGEVCEVQSQFCSGPGGQAMCNSDCTKLTSKRFANFRLMTHWETVSRADNTNDTSIEEASMMFAQIANPPGLKDLEAACAGVAPGQPNRLCNKIQTQGQNAKAADCFSQDSSEAAFNECFAEVCDVQSQFCSGSGGRSKCNSDCLKQTSRRFMACEKMMRWKINSKSTPEDQVAEESLLALSQEVFSPHTEGPSSKDLLAACNGNGAQFSHNCVVSRMKDVNTKATSCYANFSSDEKSYQSCVRNICSEQSHACTGSRGSVLCFSQCQEYASHQFTNFKAVSKLPGAHWDPSAALTSDKVEAMKKNVTKADAPLANLAKKLSRHHMNHGVNAHTASMVLVSAKTELGPDFQDLEFACSGFAPGQHNRECSMTRVRDTNARAAACFEALPRNETTFHISYQACCDGFCVNQSRTCTGEGGEKMCLSECQALSYSQVATFQALGAWHGHQKSNNMALSQHQAHVVPAKALDAPSKEELHNSCEGTSSESDDKCLMARMRDSNAKTAACYMTTPDDEDSYKSCCTNFCEEQSEACSGSRGKLSCKAQCVEYGESLFSKLKVLAEVMPEFSGMTTTTTTPPQPSDQHKVNPNAKQVLTAKKITPEANRAALAQHRAALRGRHFSKVPPSHELQTACVHQGRGEQIAGCKSLRKQHTNGNARLCFNSSPDSKADYQSCCTRFCRAQSKFCGGAGGAGVCFQQCVEEAHPIFEDLKALAAVPGALAELEKEPLVTAAPTSFSKTRKTQQMLAQQQSELKPAVTQDKKRVVSTNFRGKHDPADVARIHSVRADLK